MEKPGEKTGRLFFGIELPDAAKMAIGAHLPKNGRGLRVTRSPNLHVTLRFVGETDAEAMERAREQLATLSVEAFTLPLEGSGRFPPRGSLRVVWLGLGAAHPRLFQLRKEIDDTLLRCGVECDLREFAPHVTLARVEPGGQGAGEHLLRQFAGFEGPIISVGEICLFESKLTSAGAAYSIAQRFPLR